MGTVNIYGRKLEKQKLKAKHFTNRNGIIPYLQEERVSYYTLSTLFKIHSGLIHSFIELKRSTDDHTRIYFLGKVYCYVGELVKYLHLDWSTQTEIKHAPSYWYDIDRAEQILSLVSQQYSEWLVGDEFDLQILQKNFHEFIRSINDLCYCLDITPEYVLQLYHDAYDLTSEDIKMIKLFRPIYRKVGRPSIKDRAKRDAKVDLEEWSTPTTELMPVRERHTRAAKARQLRRYKAFLEVFNEQKRIKLWRVLNTTTENQNSTDSPSKH